jgi:hypothetical protein
VILRRKRKDLCQRSVCYGLVVSRRYVHRGSFAKDEVRIVRIVGRNGEKYYGDVAGWLTG